MHLPDFIIIGAAKAGTTSLYKALSHHPDIFFSSVKEPEFFSRDDRYNEALDGYTVLFDGARDNQLVAEASTNYTLAPHFPLTAKRIKHHLPNAKLIYIMRQPVDRAYSYYVQLTKHYQNASGDRKVHRSFEDFILPERRATAAPREKALASFDTQLPDVPELMLSGSDYVHQIETYLEHFDRNKMLFLKFEDFTRAPETTLRQITDFLDLPPLPSKALKAENTKTNVAADYFRTRAEDAAVSDLGQRLGPLWKIKQLLPAGLRGKLRTTLLPLLSPTAMPPAKMEAATRDMLNRRFAAQYDRLSELTGLNFDEWKQAAFSARFQEDPETKTPASCKAIDP